MRFLLAILFLLFALPASAQQGQGLSQALVVSSCGGQTLAQGPLTNLTMNPQGQLCLIGIAPGGFCAQASQYLSRTVGGNEGGNAANIAALICGLVSDGIITGTLAGARTCGVYLDALYILAQQNVTDAQLNLCGTSYPATAVGAPTFTTYAGFSGFNGSKFLDTGFNSTIATSPNYTQNSASYGHWAYAVVEEAAPQMGSGTQSQTYNRYTGGSFYARVNNAAGGSTPTIITKGLFVGDRTNASNVFPYQNGVSAGTVASVAGANDNADFTIGEVAGNATTDTLSAAFIGGSLGTTLELALYNRLRTYMSAVGVP